MRGAGRLWGQATSPGKAHIRFRYGKRPQTTTAKASASQARPTSADGATAFVRPGISEAEVEAINTGIAWMH